MFAVYAHSGIHHWLLIRLAVYSHGSEGNPTVYPPGLETGPVWEGPPVAASTGGPFALATAVLAAGQVVAPFLRIRQERGESVAADDVRTAFWSLAVPDGGHAVQVGRDLDAAAIVRTAAGLPPDRLRQVGHALLHSLRETFEVTRGGRGFEGGVTGTLERFDVSLH